MSAAPRPAAGPSAPPVPDPFAWSLRWEEFYLGLAPAKQQELLSLARQQGLLYAHQLQPAGNGGPPDVGRQLLGQLFSGRTDGLQPLCPDSIESLDPELDADQRDAVVRALETPDLCLIQGLPGTGKSRVAAEVVAQAAGRGERVMLLAPTPVAVDRVLAQVGARDTVCAVRCLAREENPEQLPAPVRALTYAERVRTLRERARDGAREEVCRAAAHRDRLRQDEPRGEALADLLGQQAELQTQIASLQARQQLLPAQVREELQQAEHGAAGGEPFAAAVSAAQRVRDEEMAKLEARRTCLEEQHADCGCRLAEVTRELSTLSPILEARRRGAWWTAAWWRARLRPAAVARCEQLRTEQQGLETRTAEARAAGEALDAERVRVQQEYDDQRSALVKEETRRRATALDDEVAALRHEQQLLRTKWQLLCQELEPGNPPPAAMNPEELARARAAWAARTGQAADALAFAQQWAAFVEESSDALAERLPGCVNVVAATTAALAGDEHFGDTSRAESGGPVRFDLLVLEEADQVTESEFLRLTRRARRWVLVGGPAAEEPASRPVPAAPAESRPRRDWPRKPAPARATAPSALRPGFFQRLWQHLHLGSVWVKEEDRVVCRLRPVAPEQRQWLESERVADFPDVELRILNLPQCQPVLAEIVFPPAMTILQAKQYVYQQLEQVPVSTRSARRVWVEQGDRLLLRLAAEDAPRHEPIALETGIRELVGLRPAGLNGEDAGPAGWKTCCVEFDRQAGWQRERAEEWVRRHLEVRDLGRTAWLGGQHRMRPELAAVLSGGLFPEGDPFAPKADSGPAVEFVPVPALAVERRRPRADRRAGGPDGGELVAALAKMKGGAGVELDLADLRHRDRLPSELRSVLPKQGLVNYLEGQAVVRLVDALARDAELARVAGRYGLPRPSVAVLALYPAQAELIRVLLRQGLVSPDRLDVEIGTPSSFRHREGLVAVVSLTRSHTHRAVSYGDGPQALALALTRARYKLFLVGDPGTLQRRSQWELPLDHLDETAAARERSVIGHLVQYLHGRGPYPGLFHLREGPSP
jgi:AAA domain